MYDHQTHTLWSGVTGAAIDGDLKGKQLDILAAQPKIRWKDWKVFKQTKVVTGTAVSGPLKGKTLQRILHYQIYWFGLIDFYPQTTLYRPSETTQDTTPTQH